MTHLGIFRSRAVEGAASSFEDYIHDAKSVTHGTSCLADYVEGWLYCGGIEDCSGSREMFLMAFALIIDKWLRCPNILDYKGDDETPAFERRVTAVFDGDEHGSRFYDILDPYAFEAIQTDPGRPEHYSQRPFSSPS